MKKNLYFLLSVFFLSGFSFAASAQIINTIAGNGTAGFSGDGGPAVLAKIDHAYKSCTDASGNVYIADKNNNRIRKVNTAGIITTIAGLPVAGYSGDGGPATSAQLNNPNDVQADASGNVYICDADNSRIRKINTSGIITTIAGNGTPGYGGDGGPATAALLNLPTGIALDATGNLYIDDNLNNRIRKINTSGTITTYAGTGTGGYTGDGGPATAADIPFSYGIATDGPGNLYITFYDFDKIRKVNTSGTISTIAGDGTAGFFGDGGPATAAEFDGPWGIAADATGNVFISDQNNNRIRKINTSGTISTVAGGGSSLGDGGPATAAQLNSPIGVSVDGSGNLFIVDYLHYRVRRVGPVVNHVPFFTGGHTQSLSACEDSLVSINSLLAVTDIDTGQTETWSVVTAPLHGTLVAAYTTISTGGTVTPVGLSYTPASGYIGTDSFKVRVSDGTAADTTKVHVTINAGPNAGTISGIDSLCPGDTTILTASVTGGIWTSSNLSITTISGTGHVTAVTTGTDTIKYTVTTSCGSAAAIFPFIVRPAGACVTTGINSITGANKMLIAPNPNTGTFTLNLYAAINEEVHITITNVLGVKVKELNTTTNKQEIIKPDVPAGIYFINAATAQDSYSEKVIIN